MAHVTPAPIVERRYALAFALVTTLFFSWALAAALNDVLIRQFQKALAISRTESSLIQTAFYVGYFCAAIPAGLLIRRFGYKAAILVGLGLYATGAFLFIPAADIREFGLFLLALYVIAIGLGFLETAANPYVAILGDPRTGSARLNLSQAFHGLGLIIAPTIGGLFIFTGTEHSPAQLAHMSPSAVTAWRTAEAQLVKGPYTVLGLAICLLAVLVAFSRFPPIERPTGSGRERQGFFAVLRHRHVRRAVVAQFFYVAAQVGVWSFFIDFAKSQLPETPERTAAFWLAASLGLLMVGRFSGAILQRRVSPAKLLAIYAVANILLCGCAVVLSGAPAVFALWCTSFFMSIMFPTIFALGVSGLGNETESASSFLIMSIIGGALIPPLMGLISEQFGGVHHMMVVPLACFAVVLWYAGWARSVRLTPSKTVPSHG